MVTSDDCIVQDAPAGELVLRVCGSTRDGQIVRLRSAKCTIGSGPRCTLRLASAGIRPVHCLIVRGERTTVVRRWAPDTRLNGRGFADAELAAGDRLAIGPVEFEVLDAATREPGRHGPGSPGTPPKPTPSRRQPGAAEQHERAEHAPDPSPSAPAPSPIDPRLHEAFEESLRRTARHGRRRARRLLGRLRSTMQARDRLGQQHEQVLSERARQLDEVRTELEHQRERFDQDRRRWQSEKEELESRRAELEARLATLASPSPQPADASGARAEDASVAAAPAGLPSGSAPAAETPFEEVSRGAPLSSEDVFRRLGATPLLPEDEEEGEETVLADLPGPADERPPADDAVSPIEGGTAEAEPAEDESIDQYMAQLLERVRAVREEPAGPKPRRPAAPRSAPPEPAVSEPAVPAVSEPAVPEPAVPQASPPQAGLKQPEHAGPSARPPRGAGPRGLLEISPRAAAPERTVDLSAMRELANFSAHQAIERYAKSVLSRSARGKLAVILVSLAAGAVLIWLWSVDEAGQVALYAAATAFTVALFWGVREAVLAGRHRAVASAKRGNRPSPPAAGAATVVREPEAD